MAKWWMAVALTTLAWTGKASGQFPPMAPTAPAAPMMPNFAGDPVPPPVGQFCAPGGAKPPDTPFALPNDGSPNAWSDDVPAGCQQTGCYFNIGSVGLIRQSLGNGVVALFDPQNIDTGIQPPLNAPVITRFNNVPMEMTFGPKATLGYREAGYACEITGFYLPWNQKNNITSAQGRLDLPFDAFNATPLGFQGNNFLWTQADRVTLQYESELINAEANFRCGDAFCFEWISGLRFFSAREKFGILTEDDSLTVQPINPTQVALYQVQTQNRMALAQFGFEFEHALISRVAIGANAKVAGGVNFAEINHALVRGDGFLGFNTSQSRMVPAGVGEVGLFADVLITDQWRLRVGYQALWLVNIAEAHQNVDYNLAAQGLNNRFFGDAFYHGPAIEFQFAF